MKRNSILAIANEETKKEEFWAFAECKVQICCAGGASLSLSHDGFFFFF